MAKKPKHRGLETEPGLELSKGLSIKVDWKKFGTQLTAVMANGFSIYYGMSKDIASPIASLARAAGAISVEAPPEQRLWSLFCLSFCWAVDETRSSFRLDDETTLENVRSALNIASNVIESHEAVANADFLIMPSRLPLYCIVRDHYLSLNIFTDSPLRAALKVRLDAAFNRAVCEIWSKNYEIFKPIELRLNVPGARASSSYAQWQAYKKSLIYDFEIRPIFGQEKAAISVGQLYIPLRAMRFLPNNASTGSTAKVSTDWDLVELDREFESWLLNPDPDDWLFLVGGGPGSGKSTTVKALARRIAERDDLRPLVVPLQYIDISRDLRDSINNFFTDRVDGPFREAPVSRDSVEQGPTMILLFDGLDELARPGEAAREISLFFLTKLNQLFTTLRGHGAVRLRAVVTGRIPSFQVARIYASDGDKRSYEVLGYKAPPSIRTHQSLPQKKRRLVQTDQRTEWWKKYALCTGLSAEVPRALTDPGLEEITREPLLCYLLVLSGYAVENWEDAAKNRNVIYERLINEVWRRGWGEGGRQGQGRHLSKEDFNLLMESFAFAAWLGGDTKIATEARFIETREFLRAGDCWRQFVQDNGSDVTNLAMNFYLRSSEVEKRGFEFTHKSFGDYLAARALLSMALIVMENGSSRIPAAGVEWLRATTGGVVTREVAQFLRNEMRRMVERDGVDNVIKIKEFFSKLASHSLADGFGGINSADSWRVNERQQNNAELEQNPFNLAHTLSP